MTTFTRTGVPGGRGARQLLPWILLSLLAASSWAGGGPGGGSGGGNGGGHGGGNGGGSHGDPTDVSNSCSGGEEVTSLPVVDATCGLTLVGSLRQMRSIVTSANGVGTVTVTRLGRHQFALTFTGDYRVVLNRAALASSDLGVYFRGGVPFQGGIAVVQIGSSAPVSLPADRVLLPVGRMAASSRVQGTQLTLDAAGLRTARAHIAADFGRAEVTQLAPRPSFGMRTGRLLRAVVAGQGSRWQHP